MKHLLWLGVAVLISSCGPQNYLAGSIADEIPLDFSRVEIFKQGAMLRVEYIKPIATTRSKPCKVTIDTSELEFRAGTMIRKELFLDRVVLQRSTSDHVDFPQIVRGSLQFHRFSLRDGGSLDGEFDAVFEGGKNISGVFGGRVVALD